MFPAAPTAAQPRVVADSSERPGARTPPSCLQQDQLDPGTAAGQKKVSCCAASSDPQRSRQMKGRDHLPNPPSVRVPAADSVPRWTIDKHSDYSRMRLTIRGSAPQRHHRSRRPAPTGSRCPSPPASVEVLLRAGGNQLLCCFLWPAAFGRRWCRDRLPRRPPGPRKEARRRDNVCKTGSQQEVWPDGT